jgi:hypothetical protein
MINLLPDFSQDIINNLKSSLSEAGEDKEKSMLNMRNLFLSMNAELRLSIFLGRFQIVGKKEFYSLLKNLKSFLITLILLYMKIILTALNI